MHISNILLCGEIWEYRDLFYEDFLKAVESIAQKNVPRCDILESESAAYGAALIAVERTLTTIGGM